MAEEGQQDQGTQDQGAPTPGAGDQPPAQPDRRDERISQLVNQVSSLQDTVQALVTGNRSGAAPAGAPAAGGIAGLDANAVQYYRSRGLSDEAIAELAPSIQPFLDYTVQNVGGQLLQLLGGVQDEINTLKAESARDTEGKAKFPYWGKLKPHIDTLRKEARVRGEYMTPEAAYNAAFAMHWQEVVQQPHDADAADRARDASTTTSVTGVGKAAPKSQMTVQQLLAATPEERNKLWDDPAIADQPI